MKKILTQALIVGLATGIVNFALAMLLGDSLLETPYQPETQDHLPVMEFATASGIFSFVLIMIGALLLGLLTRKNAVKGVRTWTIIGIVFLVLYGIFPFVVPVASFKAAILTNILHLVAGIPALLFLPRKAV